MAETARVNQVKTRMRGCWKDRANDYRIVWIIRALGEQRRCKRWMNCKVGEEKEVKVYMDGGNRENGKE